MQMTSKWKQMKNIQMKYIKIYKQEPNKTKSNFEKPQMDTGQPFLLKSEAKLFERSKHFIDTK